MRAVLLVALSMSSASLTQAQEFTSPLDVVSTLYNTYFLNVPVHDIEPYFSDALTTQLSGKQVGAAQFLAAGLDPLTGHLTWHPRNLEIKVLEQDRDSAQVAVSFQQDGVATAIKLDVILEPTHGWQIDHIAGTKGQESWCTNAIVSLAQDHADPD